MFGTTVDVVAEQVPGGFQSFLTSTELAKRKAAEEASKFKVIQERAETFLTGDIIVPKTAPVVSIQRGGGSLFPVTKDVELTTTREIKESLEGGSFGLAGQVFSPLIPETPLEAGIITGGFLALKAAPPIVRIGLDVAFTPGEARAVFDPTLDTATRVRSGLFAGLGAGGVFFEGVPFIKGGIRKFTGSGLPIVDEAVDVSRLFPGGEAKTIKGIPVSDLGKVDDVSDLGKVDDAFGIKLIEEGRGFDFTTAEQEAFIGERGTITTSARDLLSAGDDIVVQQGEAGLGLFFTPTLDTAAGEARVSRLGLLDLTKPSGFDAPIGFKSQKPEIVFLRDVPITRGGEPGTARGIGFPSSELEVTLLPGTEITGGKVGTAVIKGQEVGIFEAFVKGGSDDVSDAAKGIKVDIQGLDLSSTAPDIVVNPLSLVAGTVGTVKVLDASTDTTRTTSTTSTTSPTTATTTPTSLLSATVSTPTTVPTTPTSLLSPPVSPPPTVPSRPPTRPTSIPSRPPTRPTSLLSPPVSPPPTTPTRKKLPSSIKALARKAEKQPELFKVFARKGEKDIVVAKAKTEQEAFKKLKKKLKGSLRASGFVEKGGKKIAPPLLLNGDFRRSKVDPFRVVEKKAKRLRKGTTGKEVQFFRGFGSKPTKKKKGKGFFGF